MTTPTDEDGDEGGEDTGAGNKDKSGKLRAHLDAVGDGCGCTELWEELSERRADGDAE